MTKVRLGRTGITVNKNGFGALPVQRRNMEDAKQILRKAYDSGIDFFDTARAYSDSEEKIGNALSDVRDYIIIATKTPSKTVDGFWNDLHTSLTKLKTDHVDILQFHNPDFVPKPDDGTGLYEAMLKAREQGKIRFIGITNHLRARAIDAIESGLYDTVQFPFSYLSDAEDRKLPALCKEHDIGFICMKGMAGGLITRADAAYAFMAQYDNTLPIWGVQHMEELEQFLACGEKEPEWTKELQEFVEKERKELSGDFCRGCGYCMPCPVGIKINNCARMVLMVRRAPSKNWLNEEWQENMRKINDCLHCNQCASKCPYHLDTPTLLRKNLDEYEKMLRGESRI